MSFALVRQVFETSRSTLSARLVLLNLAERANGGACCWPSVASIAQETALTPRGVAGALRDLRNLGEIYTRTESGKRTYFVITVGFKVDEIAANLQYDKIGMMPDEAAQTAQAIIALQDKRADRLPVVRHAKREDTPEHYSDLNDIHDTPEQHSDLPLNNIQTNHNIEPEKNQKTLATAETSVEARPENSPAFQEPAQPTEQADAPMPESKDPTPQVPPPPSPRKRGKSDKPRKEPERGPLYKAVHEILLGITDPGDGKHMISRINTLRRIILDAEGIDRPTAEQDERLADGLRTQFGKWYRREFQKKYNKPAGALPVATDTLPVWYGAFAQARKEYEARQVAEAVKPTPAQADPGCPHCGGTGKVSIYKSVNDKWVPMRYGDLVPAGVTETASATCRCILTKGA